MYDLCENQLRGVTPSFVPENNKDPPKEQDIAINTVLHYCAHCNGISSHSYGVSLVIWAHTVLPATRHK